MIHSNYTVSKPGITKLRNSLEVESIGLVWVSNND